MITKPWCKTLRLGRSRSVATACLSDYSRFQPFRINVIEALRPDPSLFAIRGGDFDGFKLAVRLCTILSSQRKTVRGTRTVPGPVEDAMQESVAEIRSRTGEHKAVHQHQGAPRRPVTTELFHALEAPLLRPSHVMRAGISFGAVLIPTTRILTTTRTMRAERAYRTIGNRSHDMCHRAVVMRLVVLQVALLVQFRGVYSTSFRMSSTWVQVETRRSCSWRSSHIAASGPLSLLASPLFSDHLDSTRRRLSRLAEATDTQASVGVPWQGTGLGQELHSRDASASKTHWEQRMTAIVPNRIAEVLNSQVSRMQDFRGNNLHSEPFPDPRADQLTAAEHSESRMIVLLKACEAVEFHWRDGN